MAEPAPVAEPARVTEPAATLTSIAIHPVKSTAVRPLATATVTAAGLEGDRRWMVVDDAGVLVSARTDPALFTIRADTPQTEAGLPVALRLKATGHPECLAAEPVGEAAPLTIHGKPVHGVAAAAEVTTWVRRVLGRDDVRLVWCADPRRRALNPASSRPGDHTAYADGYPVTLVSLPSLRRLHEWLAETAADRGEPTPERLPVERFRPNLVVDGELEAFAEDRWAGVRVGGVAFRLAKPVDRCVMTTIDPRTLGRGHEPIRTLARHRRWQGATWFAVHLIPDVTEGGVEIAVGDGVEPVRR